MIASMADMSWSLARGTSVIAPIGWAGILLVVAVIPVLRIRFAGETVARTADRTGMALHRGLSLVLMAAFMATMGNTAHQESTIGHPGMGGMSLASAPGFAVVTSAGVVAMAGLTAWLVVHLATQSARRQWLVTEALLMFGGLVVMAVGAAG